MLGQGYQPKKSTGTNTEFVAPPKNRNGKPLDSKVSFSHAMELLYRGLSVTSPSTMYKNTHLTLFMENGKPVLYSYSPILDIEWKREALASIPTAFLFANDWAIFINLNDKK